MIRFRTFLNSMRYAMKGIRYAWKHEQNFRLQIMAAIIVIILMIVLQVSALEAVALTAVITAVLVLELANTIVEKMVDLLKPRLHHYSGVVKDMMAAAVLITSLAAVIIGCIIFIPAILRILGLDML